MVLFVYGGPNAPTVINGWQQYTLYNQILTRAGYVVVQVDNRAASGISKTLENTILLRSGEPESADLVDAVKWLKTQPWVDAGRVGVWGWSGGGTMTLNLMTRSTEFKAGVAIAAVTDWRYYDTKWAEAYMKTPQDNPDGYERTSLVKRAGSLHGSLMLVFGSYDDNVHPQNSLAFIDALIAAGKPYQSWSTRCASTASRTMRRSSTCSRRCWRSGSGSCSGHPIHPRRIHPLEVSWDPPHATDSSQARFADYPVCSSRNPAAKYGRSSAVDVLRIASPVYTPPIMASTPSRGARGRREFLKQSLSAAAAAAVPGSAIAGSRPALAAGGRRQPARGCAAARAHRARAIAYPRVFTGPRLSQISFPLGGVGAGSIGLGGRGQLRDWQIFNRPDRGNAPGYAFPAIRVDRGARAPFVSVLEARLQPPVSGPVRPRIAERARPAAARVGAVHGRVPARPGRLPRSAASGQRHARRVHPVHSARRRRFRACPSPSCDTGCRTPRRCRPPCRLRTRSRTRC